MRVLLAVVAVVMTAACGGDGEDDRVAAGQATSTAAPATTTSSAVPATTSTSVRATTTTARASATKASTAVIEPDTVAGLVLGSNKTEAIAVLGTPTRTGQDTDVSGARYDYLRWELDGNRGLTLNFRTPAATSPRLTDWVATAKGPRTKSGVQVGDPASKVVAAHGALQPFCCDSQIASLKQGTGRMIIVVPNGAAVVQIIGGDEAFWSRSIAD